MSATERYLPDSVICKEGFNALVEKLGLVGAERFVSIIIREPFDYAKWQKNLFEDVPIEELTSKADAYSRTLDSVEQ